MKQFIEKSALSKPPVGVFGDINTQPDVEIKATGGGLRLSAAQRAKEPDGGCKRCILQTYDKA